MTPILDGQENMSGKGGKGSEERGKGEKGKRGKPHQSEELNANLSSIRK